MSGTPIKAFFGRALREGGAALKRAGDMEVRHKRSICFMLYFCLFRDSLFVDLK